MPALRQCLRPGVGNFFSSRSRAFCGSLPGIEKVAAGGAGAEGLSANAWLLRVVSTALDGGERVGPPGRGKDSGIRGFTGWVR
ncbi:hypothetical protein [Streptomyces sp. NPDC048637]|uniref:hypothetical protein n=1 Tax=Streptomyces sp. NPDC048637 TaxID=3155636 RepID=UPI003440DAB0